VQKQDGIWKIVFMPSTRVPMAPQETIANDIETLEAQTALIASLVGSKFTDLQQASVVNLASLQTKDRYPPNQ
jgi:hypothetical protein